jgi:hypothetical protein
MNLTLTRMAKILMAKHYVVKQTGILIHCWWECELVSLLCKILLHNPVKLKDTWPMSVQFYAQAHITEMHKHVHQKSCVTMFTEALFIIVEN